MSSLPKTNDDGIPVVSYTQMNKFKMCPKAYEYRYVEGLREPMPGRVKYGSAFDKAVTALHAVRMDGKDPVSDVGVEAALDYIADPGEEFDETDVAADDGIVDKTVEAIREYNDVVVPNLDVVDVQREVNFETIVPTFGAAERVILTGYIDLVEMAQGVTVVTDIKTTLKKRSGKYTHDSASIDEQLTLYSALLDLVSPNANVGGRGWRVADIGRKTPGRIESVHVKDPDQKQTTDTALNGARATIGQMEAACGTGLFPPYGRGTWMCSATYCEFFNRCEYGSRARSAVPMGAL